MYVSTNKQLNNFFGVVSRLCHGKGDKTYLITNVCARYTTLCQEQRVAREPQFERQQTT
jgi:hypothetical protein